MATTENFRDAPLRWSATVLFLLFVLAAGTSGAVNIAVTVIAVLGVVLFAPPLQALAKRRWNFALAGWRQPVSFVVLIGFIFGVRMVESELAQRAEQAHAKALVLAQQKKKEATIAADRSYFAAHKDEVLAQVAALGGEKKFSEAEALAKRYLAVVQDEQLRVQSDKVAKNGLLASLNDRTLLPRERARVYEQLLKHEPGNVSYQKKAALHNKEADVREAKLLAQAAENARKAARQAKLEKQFSAWDGSHPTVERLVKASMKNPSSYEHVETRYIDLDPGMRVTTTVRGTNSFGGVVPSIFIAVVDDNGNVLSLRNP